MKRKQNNGHQYEELVAIRLKQQGFSGVKLTPKTGDFGADILCFDLRGVSCAVQCKYYSRPVGYKAVEEALAGARYYNCARALVVSSSGFTKHALNGARKLGVELYVCFYGRMSQHS